jgi:hypothetical protein
MLNKKKLSLKILTISRKRQDQKNYKKTALRIRFPRDTITILSKGVNLENHEGKKIKAQHKIDSKTLTATELRVKYHDTYVSWRNMKQRRKQGAIIQTPFMTFASFLFHMGPRPNRFYTIDRLDNKNPAYGIGLCEWRNKQDQANNRRITYFLTYKGECQPLTTWASRTNQKADTIRSRKAKGWSDVEAIEGRKEKIIHTEDQCYPEIWPSSNNLEERQDWEHNYQSYGKPTGMNRSEFLIDTCKKHMDSEVEFFKENLCEDDVHPEDRAEYRKRCKAYIRAKYYYDREMTRKHQSRPRPLRF